MILIFMKTERRLWYRRS